MMKKRLGLILIALLVVPVLLTACDSESSDVAKDYMEAVLKNDVEAAQNLACDADFQARTAELAAAFADRYTPMTIDPDSIDLKYDIAKGMNDKEVIITGSIMYIIADEEDTTEREYELSQEHESRVVLIMDNSDEWCVTGESEFGKIEARLAGNVEEAGDAESADDAESTEDAAEEDAEGAGDAESAEDAGDEAAESSD